MSKDKERRAMEKESTPRRSTRAPARRSRHHKQSTNGSSNSNSNHSNFEDVATPRQLENPRGGGNPKARTTNTGGNPNSSPSSPTFTSPQEAPTDGEGKAPRSNPSTDAPEEECSLFVGDLSRLVTEDMLMQAFAHYGEVVNVDIKRDKITRNTLGYGFIQFKKRSEAEEAFKLDGTEIGSRKIRIGWAQGTNNQKITSLFLGDLDDEVTSEMLRDIFKTYGPIVFEETYVKKNKYGFVKFKYRAHAEKAKAELDGKPLHDVNGKLIGNGRPVRIGWGDANTQRNCVHVQFDAGQCMAQGLAEDDFREAFKVYGKVIKVSLPRYADKRLKGYGFVHFEDNENGERSAARAITTLSGKEIKSVRIQCNFGKRQVSSGDVPNRFPSNNANQPELIQALLADPVYFQHIQKIMAQQSMMPGLTQGGLVNGAMMNPLGHLTNSLGNLGLATPYAGSLGVNWLTNLAAYQSNLLNLQLHTLASHPAANPAANQPHGTAARYQNWLYNAPPMGAPVVDRTGQLVNAPHAAIAGIYPTPDSRAVYGGAQMGRPAYSPPYDNKAHDGSGGGFNGSAQHGYPSKGYRTVNGSRRDARSSRSYPSHGQHQAFRTGQALVYPPMNEDPMYSNDLTPTPPPANLAYLDFLDKGTSERRGAPNGEQQRMADSSHNRRQFFGY